MLWRSKTILERHIRLELELELDLYVKVQAKFRRPWPPFPAPEVQRYSAPVLALLGRAPSFSTRKLPQTAGSLKELSDLVKG